MLSNLDRYKSDLDSLVAKGEGLYLTMLRECLPAQFDDMVNKSNEEVKDFLNTLPSFRLADFVRHYEKPKIRKELTYENYRIEDCLQGLNVTRGWEKEKVVGPDAAIPHLRQQLAIVKSVKTRFESSLFDIRQLVQADLFDSELDAAGELAKHKYTRAAGALAGWCLSGTSHKYAQIAVSSLRRSSLLSLI